MRYIIEMLLDFYQFQPMYVVIAVESLQEYTEIVCKTTQQKSMISLSALRCSTSSTDRKKESKISVIVYLKTRIGMMKSGKTKSTKGRGESDRQYNKRYIQFTVTN